MCYFWKGNIIYITRHFSLNYRQISWSQPDIEFSILHTGYLRPEIWIIFSDIRYPAEYWARYQIQHQAFSECLLQEPDIRSILARKKKRLAATKTACEKLCYVKKSRLHGTYGTSKHVAHAWRKIRSFRSTAPDLIKCLKQIK